MSEEKKQVESLFEDDFNLFEDVAEMVSGVTTDDTSTEEDTTTIVNNIVEDNTEKIAEEENTEETQEEESATEEVDETEDTEDTASNTEETDDTEDASLLTPYAKFLLEEGVLPNLNLDEFDGTADSLKGEMLKEVQGGIEYYKSSLPDEVKRLIDNYEAGVPFDKLININSERVKYSNITEEDLSSEETQKNIVLDYYKKTTRLSDERIAKQIERLSDLSELEEESKSALKELVALQDEEELQLKEQAKVAQQEAEKAREAEIETLNTTLEGTKEIIPNMVLNDVIKGKIKDNLTKAVGYDQYGNPLNKISYERAKNPLEFEIKLNYIYEITNGFTDWSSLSKVGKKSAIKELEKASSRMDSRNTGGSGIKSNTSKGSRKDLISAIDKFDF